MKYIFWLLIVGLLWSGCHKKENEFVENNKKDNVQNYLNFEIKTIDYGSSDTMEFESIKSIQNIDYGFQISSVVNENRYLWFTGFDHQNQSDSLTIIAGVRYKFEHPTYFEFNHFDIEFVYKESLDHLILDTDGAYSYNDIAIFYDRLTSLDWGKSGYGINKNQMMLTLSNENTEYYKPSSNGFYFEDESLVLDNISYDQDLGQIKFEGYLNVYIKELSCGFYMTHQIKNAKFMGIIN